MNLVSHNLEEFLKKNHSGQLIYLQPGDVWEVNDVWESEKGVQVMTQERLDYLREQIGWLATHVTEAVMPYKPRRYIGKSV